MANQVTATDYKAASIQGKQRICSGKFINPMGGTPSVHFDEEKIIYDAVDETTTTIPGGNCQVSLTNAVRELPLRSPVDDTMITVTDFIAKLQTQGNIRDEDFFTIFYSLGRRTQLARDTYNAAVKAQAIAQAAYDTDPSEANLAAMNTAIAATEAARGEM